MEFADAASPETFFTMPAKKVTVSATYKDKEQEEDESVMLLSLFVFTYPVLSFLISVCS